MQDKTNNNVGEAYAFFHDERKKEDIEEEISKARKICKSPLEMETSLSEIDNFNVEGNEDLEFHRRDSKDAGDNYALKATLPNESNQKVVSCLRDIEHKADLLLFVIHYKEGDKYIGDERFDC